MDETQRRKKQNVLKNMNSEEERKEDEVVEMIIEVIPLHSHRGETVGFYCNTEDRM